MSPNYDPDLSRIGAAAIERYHARRAGCGCVGAEVALLATTTGILLWGAQVVTGPTAAGIGLLLFVAGLILFALPVIGTIMSVLAALAWGYISYSLLTGFGNEFLGVVGGIIVAFISFALHSAFRD